LRSPLSGPTVGETLPYAREFPPLFPSKHWEQTIAANCYFCENVREIDTLRNELKNEDEIVKQRISMI
jgi:hypothetical protein